MGNEKRERFVRLAESRTNEVLKRLKILGNCSNIHMYEYKTGDIEKIFSAIEKNCREVKASFLMNLEKKEKKKGKFKL